MKCLALFLLLATLVGVSIQDCTVQEARGAVEDALEDLLKGDQHIEPPNITVIGTHTNCLATAKSYGTYSSISISVEYTYNFSGTPDEIRFNFVCHRNTWLLVNDSGIPRIPDTNPRTDCSTCYDVTVNDDHCER